MYFNENSTKKCTCVILSIDLLITMALRFFESKQCAVIELRKWFMFITSKLVFILT